MLVPALERVNTLMSFTIILLLITHTCSCALNVRELLVSIDQALAGKPLVRRSLTHSVHAMGQATLASLRVVWPLTPPRSHDARCPSSRPRTYSVSCSKLALSGRLLQNGV